jgi:hypothetical protein
VVWRGEDELLQRPVAVKEILVPLAGAQNERDAIRARVLREARALARLHSPAIVSVYDVVEESQRHWIVMELVDADSLGDVIRNLGPLPFDQVAAIGLALADALAAAHSAGVLHRDVKPGNVLLGRDGRVRLTDFGIAATEGDVTLTGAGALVGSPAYIAPERVRGSSGTSASDLWGLGATLYSAVEGQPPFEGPETYAVLSAVVEGRRRPFRLAGPLRALLTDLLDKAADKRPTVDELRRRLIPIARNAAPVPAAVMSAKAPAAAAAEGDDGLEKVVDGEPEHAPPPPAAGDGDDDAALTEVGAGRVAGAAAGAAGDTPAADRHEAVTSVGLSDLAVEAGAGGEPTRIDNVLATDGPGLPPDDPNLAGLLPVTDETDLPGADRRAGARRAGGRDRRAGRQHTAAVLAVAAATLVGAVIAVSVTLVSSGDDGPGGPSAGGPTASATATVAGEVTTNPSTVPTPAEVTPTGRHPAFPPRSSASVSALPAPTATGQPTPTPTPPATLPTRSPSPTSPQTSRTPTSTPTSPAPGPTTPPPFGL